MEEKEKAGPLGEPAVEDLGAESGAAFGAESGAPQQKQEDRKTGEVCGRFWKLRIVAAVAPAATPPSPPSAPVHARKCTKESPAPKRPHPLAPAERGLAT